MTTTSSATLSTTSLSGLGLSGLSSGLDTSSIVTKLMAIESQPQTQLQTQLTSTTTYRTALQSLNSALAAIATTAKSAAASGALSSYTATSDTSSVTASASSTASAGSISFTVGQIAKAQVSVTGTMTSWPDTSTAKPSITIQVGSGSTATTKTVQAASSSLDDVVSAINASGAGVTASKIASGTDSNGDALYRLQLRGATGAGNAFSVHEGSDTSAAELPATRISTAQDAQITLYGDTDAAQQVTSSSNTFSDLLTGVSVTVSAPTTSAATVSVSSDATAATTAAQALVTGLSTFFSGIASATAITTTTGSSGSTNTSGGVFTGDGSVRLLDDAMLSAASDPVGGRSPSSIGITLTKDGTVTFDQDAFASAMASDPAGTTAMLQTIAGRVGSASSAASDPYTGTLTQKIASEQSTESDLAKQISDWTTRLAAIQLQYTNQFNAMETALNSLSSQASYITGQISGLTTNYESSS